MDPSPKMPLKGLTVPELEDWVESLGLRRFRGRQIYRWMYQRWASSFLQMTDIAKDVRQRLDEVAELHALELVETIASSDDTHKLVFRLSRTGEHIEAVLIPTEERATLCVSSQVGCALGCAFCLTGTMGLLGNLTAGEIVDQVVWARRLFEAERHISNLVFMGMGEPLHNYDAVVKAVRLMSNDQGLNFSHRKVTVSTAGLVPQLERLADEDILLNLAVSLNATTDEQRDALMPINRRYPIADLLAALERFPLPKRARITFEYVMLAGINDGDADAHRLAALLRPLRCKVNLIPFNPHPGAAFARPGRTRVEQFQAIMEAHHYNCRIRESRGDEQLAACGQLGGGRCESSK